MENICFALLKNDQSGHRTFLFSLSMFKIWFQSLNRLKMNLVHLFMRTVLKKGMDNVNKKFPNADFFEIIFEIEELE